MAEQTTFSEGLSRLDGAPLSAPYGLTDARLQDVRGVEAALEPRDPRARIEQALDSEKETPAFTSTRFRLHLLRVEALLRGGVTLSILRRVHKLLRTALARGRERINVWQYGPIDVREVLQDVRQRLRRHGEEEESSSSMARLRELIQDTSTR